MRRDVAVRKRGRPKGTHTLTPARANRIEEAIRAGNPVKTACALAGVGTSTFYRWMHRAERAEFALALGGPYDPADEVFRNFWVSVLRARAEAAEMMVDVVFSAAVGGQLISEQPALDGSGNPIRDDDGRVIMKRQWSQSDGRLALSYVKVAQPREWAGGPSRLELSGPGGGSVAGGEDPEAENDAIDRLSARVAAALAARAEEEAERLAFETGPSDGDVGVHDAGVEDS